MLSSLRKLVFHNYVSIFLILYRYLETEHIRHCVPSNVSSGLATLPLKYVWLDGKENKSWPTNPTLPTGELLNGSQAYLNILSYFTTNSTTPLEVSNLGKEQLNIFYPTVSILNWNIWNESYFGKFKVCLCVAFLLRIFRRFDGVK